MKNRKEKTTIEDIAIGVGSVVLLFIVCWGITWLLSLIPVAPWILFLGIASPFALLVAGWFAVWLDEYGHLTPAEYMERRGRKRKNDDGENNND